MQYGGTMLLVDNQRFALNNFAEIARPRGLRPVGYCTSTDAMLLECERLRPDVVVIDVGVSGTMHAMVAIQRLRRDYPGMKVIATASPSESDLAMEALSAGAVDFVLKPFHARSVTDCLDRCLA